jgi:type VI secretion system secreted protein VgrG
MALAYTQDKRLLSIVSPLGADVLILRRLTVTEAIERPFLIEAEVLSTRDDIQPGDLLGQSVTCTVSPDQQPERHFNGMVRTFGATGVADRGLASYRLEAVPLLWNLSRTADCRIFQDKSVQDILTTLLGEGNVAPKRFGTLPGATRHYCVQFNETDLDFMHRLLDEVGGGYYFEQAEGQHTLVVTGANADFPNVPGDGMVVRGEADMPGAVTRWRVEGALRPGKLVAKDFDMLKPSSLLNSEAATILGSPNAADWEVYRWPGGQTVRPDTDMAKLPMEQAESGADTAQGDSETAALFAGGKVSIRLGLAGESKPWLITAMRHEAVDETHEADGAVATYANTFTAIPADRVWRNPNPRPRALMPALQSAVVTGPGGEEIHCDAKGRVKIQFHWDRYGKKDENTTCYVRVMQPWAGGTSPGFHGAWFLPRIGDEVLVGFLDGDVDRPVVIGSVHNDDMVPVFGLPGENTRSGIISRSTKGGGGDNANMLRFEDKKGSEEVYVQAEKDMNLLVKNQLKSTVKGNEIREVTGTSPDQTDGKRTTTVKGDETLTVQQGNRKATIQMGNESLTVSMGNMDVTVSMGNITIKASLGSIILEALQGITLKSGPMSKVEITPSGIKLDAMMIESKATMMHKTEGLMDQHTGTAMEKIGGGITMIGS